MKSTHMQTPETAEGLYNQKRLGRNISNTDALYSKTRHNRPLGADVKTARLHNDFATAERREFGHSLSFNSLSFNCQATPPTKALKSSETGSSADRREGGLLDRDLDNRVGLAGDRTGLSAGDVERRIAAILSFFGSRSGGKRQSSSALPGESVKPVESRQ